MKALFFSVTLLVTSFASAQCVSDICVGDNVLAAKELWAFDGLRVIAVDNYGVTALTRDQRQDIRQVRIEIKDVFVTQSNKCVEGVCVGDKVYLKRRGYNATVYGINPIRGTVITGGIGALAVYSPAEVKVSR